MNLTATFGHQILVSLSLIKVVHLIKKCVLNYTQNQSDFVPDLKKFRQAFLGY